MKNGKANWANEVVHIYKAVWPLHNVRPLLSLKGMRSGLEIVEDQETMNDNTFFADFRRRFMQGRSAAATLPLTVKPSLWPGKDLAATLLPTL